MEIIKKMSEVARELKAVEMANMQRYKARHIYDVYNMLQPILAKHGVIIGRELIHQESHQTKSAKGTIGTHRFQIWKFSFHAEDGSVHYTQFPCESLDWGDKAASQCDAMAYKQMLIHTFLIPTKDMQEPDDKPEMSHTESRPQSFEPSEAQIKYYKSLCSYHKLPLEEEILNGDRLKMGDEVKRIINKYGKING